RAGGGAGGGGRQTRLGGADPTHPGQRAGAPDRPRDRAGRGRARRHSARGAGVSRRSRVTACAGKVPPSGNGDLARRASGILGNTRQHPVVERPFTGSNTSSCRPLRDELEFSWISPSGLLPITRNRLRSLLLGIAT